MKRRTMVVDALAVGALLTLAPAAVAQSIAERVEAVREGKVRMSFAAHPDVCGDGSQGVSFGWTGPSVRHESGEDWEWECERGPVRVVLELRAGTITEIDTYVGGRWRPPGSRTIDLGTVPAPEAARYLITLARQLDGVVGRDAVLPAVLADSVLLWPELLEIARSDSLPRGTRKIAIFWLGQAAGGAATAGLDSIAADEGGDREIKQTAIFALAQLRGGAGVPSLIRIVKTHRDPELRRKAIFWLGQSGDPRALALFEELLLGR